MDIRNFGTSGLKVSALGYGAGNIGEDNLSEKQIESILKTAVDAGITLFDTARSYGQSEERLGKYLKSVREDIVLSTKVGYGVDGVPDWTYDSVMKGIDQALRKFDTEYIDIIHLHSCPKETLQQGEVIQALYDSRMNGKVRSISYSGEQEALSFAVECGKFDGFQSSINICDQRTISYPLPVAKIKGMGVIAKRPAANAPWRFDERPVGHYGEEYWHRWKTMNLQTDLDPMELALRFVTFTWGVDSVIVGTTNKKHLIQNAKIIQKGQLPEDVQSYVQKTFRDNDQDWVGQI